MRIYWPNLYKLLNQISNLEDRSIKVGYDVPLKQDHYIYNCVYSYRLNLKNENSELLDNIEENYLEAEIILILRHE